jgi:hypothetical protein
MRSNTAVAENFSSFSVERRKSDLFTVVDGHYFGNDGFVVPKDFDEFYQRFPQHVRNWVGRHVDRSTPKQDVEDWTQDLLIHLNCLPVNSKHREAGKQDVVQTFDPHKHYGANSARFFNYINGCLGNKFSMMRSARMKNPLCRPGNLSLTTDWEDTDRNQVDDEFCHGHSDHLRRRCERQERQWDARHALAEFSEFVKREDSSVLPAMKAIEAVETSGAAAELLGTTKADFRRMRSRLRELSRCFQTGERVPRRQRPYKRRLTTWISFRVG